MDIGFIGLGRMGGNMVERLLRGGHRVWAVTSHAEAAARLTAAGGSKVDSPPALVQSLSHPRAIWMMIPSGAPVDQAIESFVPHMQKGDTLIDGGNSNYKDSMRRAAALQAKGIEFVDVGTSGGIWGLKEGYSMMIGGAKPAVDRLRPIFETLAPSPTAGWGHVGPSGAGHFVKMVHNGIEYGMMQSFAEGFSVLQHKEEFSLDLHQVSEIWRTGSVVRSWLLDLIAAELSGNPRLDEIAPIVADSGEGRWTVAEAIDLDVPAPVITLALIERLSSRDVNSFSRRLLAAMRHQFGGHAIEAPKKSS
jgi:6-phosphogluconate dehydrogenase